MLFPFVFVYVEPRSANQNSRLLLRVSAPLPSRLQSEIRSFQTLKPVNLATSKRASSRHRDEKPVTATSLESAFRNRDAHNPFRMRIYENCWWANLTR